MSVKSVPKKGYKSVPWLFQKEIEIPEEWEVVFLKNIGQVNGRVGWKGYTQEDFVEKGKGAISLGVNNISKDNLLVTSQLTYVTWKKYDESPEIQVSKNDIIIAQRGSIGKIALIDQDLEKTTINPNVILLKNVKSSKKFIFYSLTSNNVSNQINRFISSTTIPLLTQGQINHFKLLIPTKKEQQQIASILSNVDNLIQNTNKLIKKTTRLKKSLMQELFTRGIGHTKFKKVPWLFGKEIEIPEEWGSSKLKEVVILSQGLQVPEENQSSKKLDGYERFLRIVDYQEEIPPRYVEISKRQAITNEKTIVMVRYGAGAGNVYTGLKGVIANNLFQIIPKKDNLKNNFLFIFLKRDFIENYLRNISGTTTMPNINHGLVYNLIILLPPLPEQQQIASILSNTDEKIQSYERYRQKLQNLKTSLMQKLLTGEVRVAV